MGWSKHKTKPLFFKSYFVKRIKEEEEEDNLIWATQPNVDLWGILKILILAMKEVLYSFSFFFFLFFIFCFFFFWVLVLVFQLNERFHLPYINALAKFSFHYWEPLQERRKIKWQTWPFNWGACDSQKKKKRDKRGQTKTECTNQMQNKIKKGLSGSKEKEMVRKWFT